MKNTRFLLFFSLLACGETQAFECSKAFVKTDFVICSSQQILDEEDELEGLYHILLSSKPEAEKEAFREQEREWIKQYTVSCGLYGKGKPPEEEIKKKQPCVQESILQRLKYFRSLVVALPSQDKKPVDNKQEPNPNPPNPGKTELATNGENANAGSKNLDISAIRNAEFMPVLFEHGTSGEWKTETDQECKVKLKDGEATACEQNYSINMIFSGDINNDGYKDAVVNINENPVGGNGVTSYIIIFINHDGKPQYYGGAIFAEENQPANLKAIKAKDGKIYLEIIGHKETDPYCCPSLNINEIYQFNGKHLVKVVDKSPDPSPPKPVPPPVPKPPQMPYEPNPYKRFFDGIFGAIKKSL
ncbi:hypothetical protein SAMN02949497_4760 [Methylomagnum ishizawai]|uniref:Lysozyme inhibitor LprI N-terminal domain-containing protein n=1 Tax=Methylomagnum ishizawai TaxID=1760988 RepID=A0A1Y6DCY3_9GAMM|nr:lysozyme inhibitor LprI family protein [Methylomagnum ishizawai]SMF97904.1 hypothetical protein SAMN02949497_4760 [Methylomagnum ishizawai]